MFVLNVMDLVKTKAALSKNFHIQPMEIDAMPMWEYELYIEALNALVKEENEKHKKDSEQYNMDKYKKMASPSSIQNMARGSMPKLPNTIGSMKL